LATVIIVFDGCIFGGILIAQRNASSAMALRRRLQKRGTGRLTLPLFDAASRQERVSRRRDRQIDLGLGERQADLDAPWLRSLQRA
jgi:hypothetical protein